MFATLFPLSIDKIVITKEKDMKYILILGLAFASISTAALGGKPEAGFSPRDGITFDGETGGGADVSTRPGKK